MDSGNTILESENSENKFKILVGQKTFDTDGSFMGTSLSNNFGTWHVHVSRNLTSFVGVINFVPKFKVSEDCMNFPINIAFKGTGAAPHDVSATANKLANQNCFFFAVPCPGFTNNQFTYETEVEIDTSSFDYPYVIPTVGDHLREMHETEKLADITIVTKNKKKINAHNFILSRSKIFDAMLNKHDTKEAQKATIEIVDFDYDVLVEMIRYMYTDEIPKLEQMACKLLLAADKYDLPGLGNECGSYLIKNVAFETFADVLVTADALRLPQLKEVTIDFVIENRKKIFTSESWKNLKNSNMNLAMEVMEKFVSNA